MLLSIPPKDVMMKKCMQLTEDLEKDDGRNLVHPSRLINCLVRVSINLNCKTVSVSCREFCCFRSAQIHVGKMKLWL